MGKFDKKSARGRAAAPKAKPAAPIQGNSQLDAVAAFLAAVKFRKRLFGGLDPSDVWKKIDELNSLYHNALVAERARYDLLLRMGREDPDGEFHGE